MLQVLKCATGAKVKHHLQTCPALVRNVVDLDIGMCSALKNGFIQSLGGNLCMNNFSIVFCPPSSSAQNKFNHLFLEEKAKNDMLTEDDLLSSTTQTTRYPVNYYELTQFFANY